MCRNHLKTIQSNDLEKSVEKSFRFFCYGSLVSDLRFFPPSNHQPAPLPRVALVVFIHLPSSHLTFQVILFGLLMSPSLFF